MEEEVNEKEAEEQQPPKIVIECSSPRPVVAWEICSAESHRQPDVSETQYKSLLTHSQDKASVKGDDVREGDLAQTVDLEPFNVEDGQQKSDRIQSLHTDGWGEMQENGGCLANRSHKSDEDSGAEESEGDRQRINKTSIKGKTTEGEHDTMSHGDKAILEMEDCDTHLCLGQEEDTQEKSLQQNAAVEFLASVKEERDHKTGNLPEGQAVAFSKPDNQANLSGMQNNGDKRERAASPRGKEPPLAESGKQEILFEATRTGIKHLEEEPEAISKKPRGGTEEVLAEIEKNDACEDHACEGDQDTQEVVMFTDEAVKLFEDKKQEMAETSSRSPSLLEDFCESGLVKQEVRTKPTCLEENTGELKDVGLNLEEFGFKDDNIVSKDKPKSKTKKQMLNLALASLSESNTDSGNNSIRESQAQQSKAVSNDTVSKSTAEAVTVTLAKETEKHVTMIYIEETSLNSAQEVIDEETIDPWVQTFLSQDTDGVRWQEEPEPGQQRGWKIVPLNSEGNEISSDLTDSKEQFVSQSGGSASKSDQGMSSCTKQSTFWDDARCESGTPNDESQLWTLNIPGSLLGTTSDIFIPGPESLDISKEDISEMQQSHLREAGQPMELVESQGNLNKGSGSQSDVEITDHTGQTEKQILKEGIQSSAEMDTVETKVYEDTLKDTAANSGDELEDTGSGPSRNSSVASSEEENVSRNGASQGGTESSRLLKLSLMGTPQVEFSEDYGDAPPKINRTQVTAHLTKGSRNLMEVLFHNLLYTDLKGHQITKRVLCFCGSLQMHTSVLDSSPQKSKIAVKNPRVRPPKDPRSLLHTPSLSPTPPSHPPAKKPVGFSVGGLGIGIKLPGRSFGTKRTSASSSVIIYF